jgi:hypothetical protein
MLRRDATTRLIPSLLGPSESSKEGQAAAATSSDDDNGEEDRYGVLHPEYHVFREAKTLYFDWTVTTGFREPDGLRRRVYLVNGMSLFRKGWHTGIALVVAE